MRGRFSRACVQDPNSCYVFVMLHMHLHVYLMYGLELTLRAARGRSHIAGLSGN
jgi:hypothetical protein